MMNQIVGVTVYRNKGAVWSSHTSNYNAENDIYDIRDYVEAADRKKKKENRVIGPVIES